MKDNKYRVTSFRDEIFIDEENIEEVIYRLNTKYEMMNTLYEDSEEEIERLNNIINEIEKWLESEIKRLEKIQKPNRGVKPYGQEYNNYTLLIGAYDNTLDKLKELKGSGKE